MITIENLKALRDKLQSELDAGLDSGKIKPDFRSVAYYVLHELDAEIKRLEGFNEGVRQAADRLLCEADINDGYCEEPSQFSKDIRLVANAVSK